MKKNLKYLLVILPLLLLLSNSCIKNETCISSNNNLLIEFYQAETDTTISTTTVDSLTAYFTGMEDEPLYANAKGVSMIEIPLSDTTENLELVLQINDGNDLIQIQYNPYSVFRSSECGVINRYEIYNFMPTDDKILGYLIVNKMINEANAVNIYLVVDID